MCLIASKNCVGGGPHWWSLSTPPNLLAKFQGRGGNTEGMDRKERKEREGKGERRTAEGMRGGREGREGKEKREEEASTSTMKSWI